MKYTVSIDINKDRQTVVEELQNREAAFEWMDNLTAFHLIEGEMNQVNSKYKMEFTNKGKKQNMIETITSHNPPHEITTVYEMGGVWNECINRFTEKGEQTTLEMENTFNFPVVMNLFIWLFKPVFVNQTRKSLQAFKEYVEKL